MQDTSITMCMFVIKYGRILLHLIATTTPRICKDDPLTNCSRMSTLVHICSNREEAKQLCPKYCGLCNQGKRLTLCNTLIVNCMLILFVAICPPISHDNHKKLLKDHPISSVTSSCACRIKMRNELPIN